MQASLSIFFFCFFLIILQIFPNDLPRNLFHFLKGNQNHSLFYLENFNGEIPYSFKKSDSHLQDLIRTAKTPENEEYNQEKEELKNLLKEISEYSMEVHTYIEIPEREKIRIVPKMKKILPFGLPIRLFGWIYSENYLAKISIYLSHPTLGRKKIELGNLNFFGWKRLETQIPVWKVPRLNILRKERFELEEIVIEFSKKQPRTVVHLYLHQFLLLIEKPIPYYPGIELEDGWRLH